MSNVIAFPSKPDDSDDGSHLEGPAKCLACNHTWNAVGPVGLVNDLECPECGLCRGARTTTLEPSDGTVFRCYCGNDYYLLTMTGAPMCANCGVRATDWAGD